MFSSDLVNKFFNIKKEYPSYNDSFENFGYDSSLIILNMGLSSLIFVFGMSMVLIGECLN